MDISSNNNFISQSVVLLLLCFTFNGISMASDTIYASQSLSGNQTLTSPGDRLSWVSSQQVTLETIT
ncbi:hypothetical protein ACFX2K_024375 [Malus domestica]